MRAFALGVSAVLASGCVAFNDQCQTPLDNPNERVAFIAKGTEIYLDRVNARHANNAIGQQAADAFVWVFPDGDRVDFGAINGGGIRADGLCVTRNIIKEGPLTNGVLHELLPFDNGVAAVDLSEDEVIKVFEHAAEGLYTAPAPITAPSAPFLQVSRSVAVTYDCARPANSRVTALSIGGQRVMLGSPRPFPGTKYRAAMSTFLLNGGDSYSMLAGKLNDPARNGAPAPRFGGIDSNITAAYLKDSQFNETLEAGIRVENRVTFVNCTTAPRPAN